MMDRERAYIPRLQIEFIDLITLPVYRKVLDQYYLHVKLFLFGRFGRFLALEAIQLSSMKLMNDNSVRKQFVFWTFI